MGIEIIHATVTEMQGDNLYYKVALENGWYMHREEYGKNEYGGKIYKTIGTFEPNFDFSNLEIIPEEKLPEDAEVC